MTVISKHADHEEQRVEDRLQEGRVGVEQRVVREADEAVADRVERIVLLEGEPQRDGQRHDHPDEQQHHGWRHHEAGKRAGLLGCHDGHPLGSRLTGAVPEFHACDRKVAGVSHGRSDGVRRRGLGAGCPKGRRPRRMTGGRIRHREEPT